MTAAQLKNAILQYAIQGKLVPQNPNDEPASVLLEKIKKERKALVKAGKIKKDKSAKPITADEIPFEIPENWEWVRLGDICFYIQRGKSPKYSLIRKYPVIAQKCNQWTGLDVEKAQFIDPDSLSTYAEERILQTNDLLWNSTGLGTLGRIVLYESGTNPYELAVADSHVTVIRPLQKFVLSTYLYYYFANPTVQDVIENQSEGSTKQKELATETIINYLIPLPPLTEQKRIVKRVEELLPLVNKYDKAEQELTALDKEFPDKFKKSVLQSAVQGKLVPQDPNDEPAGVLVERIRSQRKKLVREGKIKRNKDESVIFKRDNSYYEKRGGVETCIDGELPFAIPESWAWVRLGEICSVARGGSPRPIQNYLTIAEDGINWIKIGDTDIGGKYINSTKEKIKQEGISKSRFVHRGDFLLTNSMSFGRPYVLNIDGCIHDGWLVLSDYQETLDIDYFYYALSSRFAYYQFCGQVSGAVVKNLNSEKVSDSLFPLPPLAEQHGIVTQIDTLFSTSDKL